MQGVEMSLTYVFIIFGIIISWRRGEIFGVVNTGCLAFIQRRQGIWGITMPWQIPAEGCRKAQNHSIGSKPIPPKFEVPVQIHTSVHSSFNKYLLSTHYVPSIIRGTGDTVMHKSDKSSWPVVVRNYSQELPSHWEMQTIHKITKYMIQ